MGDAGGGPRLHLRSLTEAFVRPTASLPIRGRCEAKSLEEEPAGLPPVTTQEGRGGCCHSGPLHSVQFPTQHAFPALLSPCSRDSSLAVPCPHPCRGPPSIPAHGPWPSRAASLWLMDLQVALPERVSTEMVVPISLGNAGPQLLRKEKENTLCFGWRLTDPELCVLMLPGQWPLIPKCPCGSRPSPGPCVVAACRDAQPAGLHSGGDGLC